MAVQDAAGPSALIARWRRFSMTPAMRPFTEWRVFHKWHAQGRPVPAPPIVKQRIVKTCLRESGLTTVVETGTFTGDMVDALAPHAARIVSIELDPALHQAALKRFAALRHVELLQGDSGTVLPRVIRDLRAPALFWLDGHYAGPGTARTTLESPIRAEIEALLAHPIAGHVVLIDDARQFSGEGGYPTVEQLREMILARQPHAAFTVADDIIRWITRND